MYICQNSLDCTFSIGMFYFMQLCRFPSTASRWLNRKEIHQFWRLEIQNQGFGRTVLPLKVLGSPSALLSFWCLQAILGGP